MAASWSGVATSGFVVEGGYNRPGEPSNQWGRWELAGLVPEPGATCDFWRRPETVLDRAAAAGCDAIGLSVEWARVEPEEGRVDTRALARYGEILALCADRGMAPVVTLHHRTHPGWLGEELWLTPGAPDRFASHVARVVEHLGDRCDRWVTVHEANAETVAGWLVGATPPGRLGAVSDAWAVLDNFLTAHLLAYEAIHRRQPDAAVTLAPLASTVYEGHQLLVDLLCARHLGVGPDVLDEWLGDRRAAHDRQLRPVGRAEAALRALAAAVSPFGPARTQPRRALRRPSPRRAVDVLYAGPHDLPLDAVAVSWRQPVPTRLVQLRGTGSRRGRPGGQRSPWLREPWEVPPATEGLLGWCRSQAALTPALPRWVVDGGVPRPPGGGPRADGWELARYLQVQRAALEDAATAGVPVTGYLLAWPGGLDAEEGRDVTRAFQALAAWHQPSS